MNSENVKVEADSVSFSRRFNLAAQADLKAPPKSETKEYQDDGRPWPATTPLRLMDLNVFRVFDAMMLHRSVRKASQTLSVTTYFPAEVRSKVLNAFSQAELSKREIEVLEKMPRGKSNKEIGAALYISQGTVGYHVSSVLKKLGAVGRAEAIATALRRGLVLLT